MTVGSYSMDAFVNVSGGWVGTKGSCSWSGSDSPRVAGTQATYHYILRERWDKKLRRYVATTVRVKLAGGRPPKRAKTKNPYTKTYIRLEDRMGTNWKGGVGPFPITAFMGIGAWNSVNALTANDQYKLIQKLNELIKGSDFNMSTFLGESNQTLKMLADSATRIAKALHHAKKLDVFGAARSLFEGTSRKPLPKHDWTKNRPGSGSAKNASALWLELQYGWRPLLGDAEACAQSIAHAVNVPFRQTYRTKVRRETFYKIGPIDVGSGNIQTAIGAKVRTRYLVAEISEKPSVLAQLGLLNPEVVAWELLPFSFVADWFIPIGSWMEARAAASHLTGTFVTSEKATGLVDKCTLNGKEYTDVYYRGMTFSRSAPSTSLKTDFPSFKPLSEAASWMHCANAIALVTQFATGDKPRFH